MEKTSPWAALYFVALMTFGNYVLFNLLVAILVEGFSSERVEREQKERDAEEKAERDAKRHPKPKQAIESPPTRTEAPGTSSTLMPAPIIITHTAATPTVRIRITPDF